MYWQTGHLLDNGKYIVEKILGSGGYGVTYRAKEQKTAKVFAIKTLNHKTQERKDFAEIQVKFINEAIALATCHHQNIVRVYPQLFQEGNLWCMVMDYVEGPDLGQYVGERGKLSEQEAITLIKPLGDALTLVHQRGFLHRDVKPNNILLRQSDQTPVLIDFGLAREFNEGTLNSMTNARTECYAPIEQYERQGKFGPYTDVYALAATLYSLVTGELPFAAEVRKYDVPLVPPQKHNPLLSDNINNAILKGMEFEANNRPQSVSEWLELLQPISPVIKEEQQVLSIPPLQSRVREEQNPVKPINPPERGILEVFQAKKAQQSSIQFYTENLPGNIKLEMIAIPSGSFLMGSPDGVGYDSEHPQHRVNVPAFYMGKYPVTQEQYQAIIGTNPSRFKENGSKNPVECVSWYDAIEFCIKLSAITGKQYRLPSEAEWEYACRAGTETKYYFGDDENQLGAYAWYYGNSNSKTHPVGEKKPNPWGLYDMHGNVWEWCLDDWHDNYTNAPDDGKAWFNDNISQQVISKVTDNGGSMLCYDLTVIKTNRNNSHLLRGGSWDDYADDCRSAIRLHYRPDGDYYFIGFRVVCVVRRT